MLGNLYAAAKLSVVNLGIYPVPKFQMNLTLNGVGMIATGDGFALNHNEQGFVYHANRDRQLETAIVQHILGNDTNIPWDVDATNSVTPEYDPGTWEHVSRLQQRPNSAVNLDAHVIGTYYQPGSLFSHSLSDLEAQELLEELRIDEARELYHSILFGELRK